MAFWNSKKIEIFSRHCLFSSISQHKKRFPYFSREFCYRNLLATLDPKKANLTFFFDGSRKDHFLNAEKRFPVIEVEAGSEANSFLQLLSHVEKLNLDPDTILYFVEDDYFHRPGWIDILLEGFQLPNVDYVTLYDHRDKYFLPMYQTLASKIFITPSCHWRTTPSTTQTFAVRYKTLMQHLPTHRRFSEGRKISADHEKFCHLLAQGATLISSLPGFSTHAEPEFASPCLNWEQLTKEELCTPKHSL